MKQTMYLAVVCVFLTALVVGPSFVAASDDKDASTSSEQKKGADVETTAEASAADESLGTKAKRAPAKPQTLAGLASGININAPKSEGGSIVISNENLQTMGKGAVVTEANNAMAPSAVDGRSDREDAAEKRDREIESARREVEQLKAQVAAAKAANETNRAVNTYNGSGPQYRAGGQVNPLETQQQQLEGKLNQAQGKLTSLENANARANQRRTPRQGSGDDGEH